MAWTEKYVTTTGTEAWATNSSSNPSSITEAIANVAAGQRVNVKAGTYSSGTTNREFATAGTTTSPIWWRGYNSSPGDLDSRPTSQRTPGTDMPLFTSTTGRYHISGDYQKFSNIAFTSAYTAAGTLMARGKGCVYHRCRMENTSTSTSACAVDMATQTESVISECFLNTTSTSVDVIKVTSAHHLIFGSKIQGGRGGLVNSGANVVIVVGCIFEDQNTVCIDNGNGLITVIGNTFYNAGTDCILISGTSFGTKIIGNVFDTAGGYAINNNTGVSSSLNAIVNNLYRDGSFTSGRLNGITESLEFADQNNTSDPFVNAATENYTLDSGANGYATAFLFEKDGPTSYRDIGAIQHQDAGGGGGGLLRVNMNGGM